MENKEKSALTSINKIKMFKDIMQKLTLDIELNYNERSYILGSAILFLSEYKKDKRYKSYFEFAYYIILKYSLNYKDFQPLYDISLNYGFYPIVEMIYEKQLLKNLGISDIIIETYIDKYKNNGYIETLNQNKVRNEIMNSDAYEISYVAPTSFGKSSIVLEHIKANNQYNKIAIIVPTKSLLNQTYKNVKEINLNRKLIIHDEMYNGEIKFIAILTQERALRLLEKNDMLFFDLLYIDEAHNLFEKDQRNILLSRLIRKNKIRNSEQKVIYLSPLISNSQNLRVDTNQVIEEQRIEFNVKEPEIYEYMLNNEILKYNRFINEFYKLGKGSNYVEYIKNNSKNKAFIYIRSPKKIEIFSNELFSCLPNMANNEEINSIIDILEKYVHKDFYMNKLLKKGILYLHGKLPDSIKEYLEYKYRTVNSIKYVIANTVILEGINLPLESMFILNTYSLSGKDLTNLIGRVNRLDSVFNKDDGDSSKLLPQIHFVNTEKYNRIDSNMTNKICLLRSRRFDDIVENPTLASFDFDKLKIDKNNIKKIKREVDGIIAAENYILAETTSLNDILKKKIIELGINYIYSVDDKLLTLINKKISKAQKQKGWFDFKVINRIYLIFIKNIDQIIDYEFLRLDEQETRNYYDIFIQNSRNRPLSYQVTQQFKYFKKRIVDKNSEFYIGQSYGEIRKNTSYYSNSREVYVDLSKKDDIQLINLAIVKIKMEQDFISFKYNKFIELLFYYELLTAEEYNIEIYGTNDKKKLNLIKFGLTNNVIVKLEKDKQLDNLYIDLNNNLRCTKKFEQYKRKQDDYFIFELNKFL